MWGFRSGFFKTRSTLPCCFRRQSSPSFFITGFPASLHRQPILDPFTALWHLLCSVPVPALPFFCFLFCCYCIFCCCFCFLVILCVCSLLVFTMSYPRGETLFLTLFLIFLLVLLLSVAMVVLSGFSFAVVVISFFISKTFQSFHATITCFSSATTSGESHAAFLAEDEACSFVFLFWFGICLCNALYCAHVVRWALLQRYSEKHSQPLCK